MAIVAQAQARDGRQRGPEPAGVLWVVATPIGNLDDMAPRAVAVLKAVDVVAAEDTRTSQALLARYGIATRTVALHDHNEREAGAKLVARMGAGESVALISDAGTPLVSDPGFRFVRAARAAGLSVQVVPGPCAAVAALALAGLPTDRFSFEGFLPHKQAARLDALRALADEPRTQVYYEAKHRIVEMLRDLAATHGPARDVVVARELTKLHETVLAGAAAEVAARIEGDREQQLGEFVVVVAGAPEADRKSQQLAEGRRVLALLLAADIPASRAARLAAEITGAPKNALYQRIEHREDG